MSLRTLWHLRQRVYSLLCGCSSAASSTSVRRRPPARPLANRPRVERRAPSNRLRGLPNPCAGRRASHGHSKGRLTHARERRHPRSSRCCCWRPWQGNSPDETTCTVRWLTASYFIRFDLAEHVEQSADATGRLICSASALARAHPPSHMWTLGWRRMPQAAQRRPPPTRGRASAADYLATAPCRQAGEPRAGGFLLPSETIAKFGATKIGCSIRTACFPLTISPLSRNKF